MNYSSYITIVVLFFVSLTISSPSAADAGSGSKKFEQLEAVLPTPNVYRTASGAPGSDYWQQQVDYNIKVTLDESLRRITGSQTIQYKNNSPDTLRYLWLQLDQNRFADESIFRLTNTRSKDRITFNDLREAHTYEDTEYGYLISRVEDTRGNALPVKLSGTMMRLDLPTPLAPGKSTSFEIDWNYSIPEEVAMGSRSGYEHFPDNDTYIFFIAQWFPRLAAYTDYTGWQNKQFIDNGEFTLEFGDYDVAITVPADHIVSATGSLQNPKDVLTEVQQARLARANPNGQTFVVTSEEALENEAEKTTSNKTWRFKAENVRDFAFASSRKFIWDVMLHPQPGAKHDQVLAMSFYPNEAEPIWSHYSTQAVIHTMEVYSRFAFDYPYPTAQSVNTWASGGMEYPMISFNGYRPSQPEDESDLEPVQPASTEPTYSRKVKYGLIGVIIHEVGHVYFPMVVNSDERRWTWMDEGLNSFLEYIAELEWEESFPTHDDFSNVLDYIPTYMTSEGQVPVMTQSDSILQFGPNAYTKPTAALIVLRETVMGRELFDFAFRQYAQRWMFKRPTPADFFRTMEDASAVDLDWFWRGWFYTTDHVDVAVTDVRHYKIATQNPDVDNPELRRIWERDYPAPIAEARNRTNGKSRIERVPGLKDLYNENDRFTASNKDRNEYQEYLDDLDDWELAAMQRALAADNHFYFVDFTNLGGLVTPLPITVTYTDDSVRSLLIPAEIWRRDAVQVTQMFIEPKPIRSISIDDQHQIADADYSNNQFPPSIRRSQLELYKSDEKSRDLMKDMLVELKADNSEGKTVPLAVPAN